MDEDEPGPGSYLWESNSLNHMIKESESFSKKGLGNGFISKADRFKNDELARIMGMPGPGTYVSAIHSESLIGEHIYSPNRLTDKYKFKNKSSIFIPALTHSLSKPLITPGPGSYKVEKNPNSNMVIGATSGSESAFNSGSLKGDIMIRA